MADQVPHEVKIERMERLVEADPAHRPRAEPRAHRPRRGGARRGPVAHRPHRAARPDAPQHDGQLHRHCSGRRARRRADRGRHVDDASRTSQTSSVTNARHSGRMRVLDHRLLGPDRHEPRPAPARATATRCSASTSARTRGRDAFPTLLQDLAGHYPAFRGGIGGVEYPEVDLVVHLAAHAKVHQLVREPHRALENAIMTFNVLEYARGARAAARVLVDARGLRRRAPVRGVRRRGRRLRLHGEPVLGVEDHERGVHLLVRALLRPRLSRLPLLERLRALRQRPVAHGARAAAVHAPAVARRGDHDLRRRREGARLHVHRRLRRRHRARRLRARREARARTRRSTSPTARATRSCARPS